MYVKDLRVYFIWETSYSYLRVSRVLGSGFPGGVSERGVTQVGVGGYLLVGQKIPCREGYNMVYCPLAPTQLWNGPVRIYDNTLYTKE